jgi:hypothetical protein
MLYTVSLFQHKQQNYCTAVSSGDPSGYDLTARPGFANPGLQAAVDRFFTRAAPFFNSGDVSFDGWKLETFVSGAWVFTNAGITSVSPSGSGVPEIANGLCISGKSGDNRNFPLFLYEGTFGVATKISSPAGLNTVSRALMNYVFNADGTDINTDAYVWRMSRGSHYAQRWVAWIVDTNEKLRRRRRIK